MILYKPFSLFFIETVSLSYSYENQAEFILKIQFFTVFDKKNDEKPILSFQISVFENVGSP